MADAAAPDSAGATRGGFGRGGSSGGRGRGGSRGRGRGNRSGGRGAGDAKEWYPCTKLGRLVKDGMIKKIEEIYLFSLPIKEAEIIDFFLGSKLKDEVRRMFGIRQTRDLVFY